jgi:fimbrial isopeptide formation D2 family protein/LPXTG-motif cell wall-anchored protein
MSNSKGGGFASKTDEITYTISQKVPDWVTSVKTWVDLDPVLQYTVDEGDVTVTCDGEAVEGTAVSIEGQRLTITVADASSLRGKTINIAYRAMLRSDANLDAYLNSAGTTASVPYQAHTVFDGEEDNAVESEEEFVKFQVGSSSGASKQSSATPATAKTTGTLAKTGDVTSFAPVAVAAVSGALALVVARRRR